MLAGVALFGERLRRAQWVAVALSVTAVVVMVVGHGSFPWLAILLALSFGGYGLTKKRLGASLPALHSLSAETVFLMPAALGLLVCAVILRYRLDATAHAEILAIRAACAALGSERLPGHELWVTLEPCPMCAAAISAARIARLYYGASDPRMGGVAHGAQVFRHAQCHHRPEVYDGLAAPESRDLLRRFFAQRR